MPRQMRSYKSIARELGIPERAPREDIVHLATPDFVGAGCGTPSPVWLSTNPSQVTCARCRLRMRRAAEREARAS